MGFSIKFFSLEPRTTGSVSIKIERHTEPSIVKSNRRSLR